MDVFIDTDNIDNIKKEKSTSVESYGVF